MDHRPRRAESEHRRQNKSNLSITPGLPTAVATIRSAVADQIPRRRPVATDSQRARSHNRPSQGPRAPVPRRRQRRDRRQLDMRSPRRALHLAQIRCAQADGSDATAQTTEDSDSDGKLAEHACRLAAGRVPIPRLGLARSAPALLAVLPTGAVHRHEFDSLYSSPATETIATRELRLSSSPGQAFPLLAHAGI